MGGDISIGAIGAALIAAVVSLLGLIITKEQKTSDFRQAWTDSLRLEIAQYLTSFNAIVDAVKIPYKTQAEKNEILSPLYSKFNEANFAINLRLNAKEATAKRLLYCMLRLSSLTANDCDLVPSKIRPIEIELLSISKEILKYEWKRVKRGEFMFVLTKFVSLIVIVLTFIVLLLNNHAESGTTPKSPYHMINANLF